MSGCRFFFFALFFVFFGALSIKAVELLWKFGTLGKGKWKGNGSLHIGTLL